MVARPGVEASTPRPAKGRRVTFLAQHWPLLLTTSRTDVPVPVIAMAAIGGGVVAAAAGLLLAKWLRLL